MEVMVKFTKVLRVTDDFVRVLSEDGKQITVTKPHDKSIKLKEPYCGEGFLFCPHSMAAGAIVAQ